MEWKIGEIRQINGEWYQCLKSASCDECAFISNCIYYPNFKCSADDRIDNCSVIFKKLEKVGEPITERGRTFQCLKALTTECVGCVFLDSKKSCDKDHYIDGPCPDREIWVEIKQTKEDMEEKEQCGYNLFEIIEKAKKHLLSSTNIESSKEEMKVLDNFLIRCWKMGWLDKYNDTKHSNSEKIGKNLKPFDLEAAKAGKPVCTRDGRKARIVCFDRRLFYKNVSYPILALVEGSDGEDYVCGYNEKGKVLIEDGAEYKDDLMMLPEKKEGWVNVYYDNDASSHRGCRFIYDTKERAVKEAGNSYITTVKINWEE